jgi:hypothetical protein
MSPEFGLGMMDTDWDGKYLGVVRTANVGWHYIRNATLDCQKSVPYSGLK